MPLPAATLPPLSIVGVTASGKSSLALDLAERHGGEIVSVDSMQVYRGMDIGTAKPTRGEQARVPHHLIDLLDANEECSVAWFRDRADEVLSSLAERSVPVILVGGTGLYHRAIVDRLELPGRFEQISAELDSVADTASLHARLRALDPEAAARMDPANRRRIIRALEVTIGSGRPFSSYGPGLEVYPRSSTVIVGLGVQRAQLEDRLTTRFDAQLAAGFVDEVRRIEATTGWSRTAAQALGYRELLDHVRDGRPLAECRSDAIVHIRRFAVRQDRWFRRDPRIVWFDAASPDLLEQVSAHWQKAGEHDDDGSLP